MQFFSTRGGEQIDLVGAIMRGIAADGGLFVPDRLPFFGPEDFKGESLSEIAAELLQPFFAESALAQELAAICDDALNFPLPLVELAGAPRPLSVLELFHGPTAAFKDVGARFLAALMERALALNSSDDGRPLTILCATSGDTGGAVAAAFDGRRGIRVAVLYPKGQISARQEHQLTCWGDNIRAFEIDGTFDDCQAIVKRAFLDEKLAASHRLTAANSINLGRLLPQAAYHAAGALWQWRRTSVPAGFIVPTGNLGNGLACVWAQRMGLPIREVLLAVNANRSIPDLLESGQWRPRESLRTLASAMDVGAPSNMERLLQLLPDFVDLKATIESCSVNDAEIRAQISKDFDLYGRIWCPHTATGFFAYDRLDDSRKRSPWVVCATAHPAKFDSIVEPIIGQPVPVPDSLNELLARPTAKTSLAAELDELRDELTRWT